MSSSFPLIVGIVNVTPDSFSDGGLFKSAQDAADHAQSLIADGADMLDIGGESTGPGATSVSEQEELDRIIPVIELIRKNNSSTQISIDTMKSNVAEAAINAGASIINDVSAAQHDSMMLSTAARLRVPIILMHQGQTHDKNMDASETALNIVDEVVSFLNKQKQRALEAGVSEVIVDVGIGFGKSSEDNIRLMKSLSEIHARVQSPMMLGISRKRIVGLLANVENAKDRDVSTALIHALLIHSPVKYLRAHNVSYLRQLRDIINGMNAITT